MPRLLHVPEPARRLGLWSANVVAALPWFRMHGSACRFGAAHVGPIASSRLFVAALCWRLIEMTSCSGPGVTPFVSHTGGGAPLLDPSNLIAVRCAGQPSLVPPGVTGAAMDVPPPVNLPSGANPPASGGVLFGQSRSSPSARKGCSVISRTRRARRSVILPMTLEIASICCPNLRRFLSKGDNS